MTCYHFISAIKSSIALTLCMVKVSVIWNFGLPVILEYSRVFMNEMTWVEIDLNGYVDGRNCGVKNCRMKMSHSEDEIISHMKCKQLADKLTG